MSRGWESWADAVKSRGERRDPSGPGPEDAVWNLGWWRRGQGGRGKGGPDEIPEQGGRGRAGGMKVSEVDQPWCWSWLRTQGGVWLRESVVGVEPERGLWVNNL